MNRSNEVDADAPEPDLWEAAKANDVPRLNYLLSGGEGANQRDDRGLTPLHVAATFGALEATQLLLLRGADTSASDWESGWTPLHRSFYFGHVKLSLLLLKHGANLGDEFEGDWRRDLSMNRPTNRRIRNCSRWDIHDHDGNTPLDLLCEHLKENLRQQEGPRKQQQQRQHTTNQAKVTSDCRAEVYTFGKADFQLGIPLPKASSDVSRPRRIDDLLCLPVCAIAAAKYHSMALTSKGQVYSWGHGRTGRLGHGDEHVRPSPCQIMSFAKKQVVKIAAGENHSAAVTADGDLYTWGSDRFGQLGHGASGGKHCFAPRKVDALRRSVVTDVATGCAHTIAATRHAEVYTWGSNKNGQLGLREVEMSNTPFSTPRLVQFSAVSKTSDLRTSRSAVQVAAGSVNCVVNFTSIDYGPSEVFQWGWTVSSPQRITFISSSSSSGLVDRGGVTFHTNPLPSIVQVAAGKFHNVALTVYGEVYSWGIGSDVLGHGPAETYSTKPQLVEALLPENGGGKVIHISASPNRTCAVTDTGEVFSWGSATEPGVLGNGSATYQPVPKRVMGVQRAVSVCAADDHTLVLLRTSVPPLPHAQLFAPSQILQDFAPPKDGIVHRQAEDLLDRITAQQAMQPADPDWMHFPEMFDMDEDMEAPQQAPASPPALESAHCEAGYSPPTLAQICEHALAKQIDIKNAVSLLTNAEMLSSEALVQFAAEYIRRNFDAILVVGKQSDIDLLLEDVGDQVHANLQGSIQSSQFCGSPPVQPSPLSPQTPTKNLSSDPSSFVKAIKAAKKKLATIELLEQQQTSGKNLLPEQLEKMARKAAVQKEILSLEQRLLRAQKDQELRDSARAAAPPALVAATASVTAPLLELVSEADPAQSKPTPKKGRAKFVSLDAYQQRVRDTTTQNVQVAATTPTQDSARPSVSASRSWGSPSKPLGMDRGVSSPIPISGDLGGTTHVANPAPNGHRSSPLQRKPATPQSSNVASSPSTQMNLATFLTAKPKYKTKKADAEGQCASPSERGWTMAASPSSHKSLLEIQREEEKSKTQSVTVHHSGNDSAWFMERRRRAGSMESIIAEQEAIAAVEQFERMEQERMQQEQLQQQQFQQRQQSTQASQPRSRQGDATKPRRKPQPADNKHAAGGEAIGAASGAAAGPTSGSKVDKKRRHKPRGTRGQGDTCRPPSSA